MRRRPKTLRQILLETLVASPLALAALGASCGPHFGPCGTHVVVMAVTPQSFSDGGVDCSPCGDAVSCNPVTINGKTDLSCNEYDECPGGRRPAALLASRRSIVPSSITPSSSGAFFSAAARLEAASVLAFRVLGGELAAHGAHPKLTAWCQRSAREEIEHAKLTAALARRYGSEPERPDYAESAGVQTLEAIATENAIEGCARESFGAAMAVWQAAHARDPAVAASMAQIARDEIRHAELAWTIADWSLPKISRAARRRAAEARSLAAGELVKQVGPRSRAAEIQAGLPSAEMQHELAARFAAALA